MLPAVHDHESSRIKPFNKIVPVALLEIAEPPQMPITGIVPSAFESETITSPAVVEMQTVWKAESASPARSCAESPVDV